MVPDSRECQQANLGQLVTPPKISAYLAGQRHPHVVGTGCLANGSEKPQGFRHTHCVARALLGAALSDIVIAVAGDGSVLVN